MKAEIEVAAGDEVAARPAMTLDEALGVKHQRKIEAEKVLDRMRDDGRGEEADRLREMMLDPEVTTYKLSKVFGLIGYPLGKEPISLYRKRNGA